MFGPSSYRSTFLSYSIEEQLPDSLLRADLESARTDEYIRGLISGLSHRYVDSGGETNGNFTKIRTKVVEEKEGKQYFDS